MIALAAIALAFGCSFSGASPGDNESPEPNQCDWTFAPTHVQDVCALEAGVAVTLDAGETIDTDNESALPDLKFVTNDDGVEIARWVVARLRFDSSVRVIGSRPLHIVAHSTIQIFDEIDLLGRQDSLAAGAEDQVQCANATGKPGTDGDDGAGGGGGGGFAVAGAAGEEGNGDTAGGEPEHPGGIGGDAVGVRFQAGCAGGRGGNADVGVGGGVGGNGGGALHLVARDSIAISGTINAGGGGGRASDFHSDGGGGGGGSGGYIGLESPSISIGSAFAFLAANGGGGGGGTSNSEAGEQPGNDGASAAEAAEGGRGAYGTNLRGGGDGGDGGFLSTLPTTENFDPFGGGGGGGGGIGVIVVGTTGAAPDPEQFSPVYGEFDLSPR